MTTKFQQRGIYLTVMYFTAIMLLSNLANAQEKKEGYQRSSLHIINIENLNFDNAAKVTTAYSKYIFPPNYDQHDIGQNIINLDASVSSFYTENATYPILNAAKLIFATDTDPASINVSGKSYMLGNATIDLPSDQTNLTLLQISNTEIVCTRVNKYSPQTSTF